MRARVRAAVVWGLAGYFASGRGCARSCLRPLSPTPFAGTGLFFGKMSDTAVADTRRLNSKPQDLTDAYGPPSNFLEIDIFNPQTVGVGRARFTTYEVRMRVSHGVRETAEGGRSRRGGGMGTTNGGPPWRGHVRVRAWKVWRGGCRLSCGPRVQKSPEGTWGGDEGKQVLTRKK